jgi:hypothetical protein
VERKEGWQKSVKGWVTAAIGMIYWILDHWGRGQAAFDIYESLPSWFSYVSPYIAPTLFFVAIAFFEIQRRKTRSSKQSFRSILRGFRSGRLVLYGILIFALAGSGTWILLQPDMNASISASMIGEVAGAVSMGTAVLFVTIANTGPPSIADNWQLSVRLTDGEVAPAIPIKGRFEFSDPHGKPITINEGLLDEKVRETVIPTGSKEGGILMFSFPGYRRDVLDVPGNKFTLTFSDARGRRYSADYTLTAKTLAY